MPRIGTGLANGIGARAVAARAAREATLEAGDARPSLALVFATEQYEAGEVLAGVREALGDVPVAGCHVPGVVARDLVTHDGVAVLVVSGDDLVARIGSSEGAGADPRGAGDRAACAATGPLFDEGFAYERTTLLVMPDAISGNCVEVARGVGEAVGASVRVAGGGSGDDLHFRGAWQFTGDEARNDSVVAVALGSAAPIGMALRHGCVPYGPPATVTRATGRVVHEIDWERAHGQYVAMAQGQGDRIEDFTSFAMLHPFGIPQGDETYVLRSPLQVGADGEIFCCSDLPRDGVVRMMVGTGESLLAAARDAAAEAQRQLGDAKAAAALVFSCVSRDFVLGRGAAGPSAEVAAVREALGPEVPVFGCLMFGQFGALGGGATQFHSKSVQVCLIGEARA